MSYIITIFVHTHKLCIMKVKDEPSIDKIRELLVNNIDRIANQPKDEHMLITNEYSLTIHEKEVCKRLLRILDKSGLY